MSSKYYITTSLKGALKALKNGTPVPVKLSDLEKEIYQWVRTAVAENEKQFELIKQQNHAMMKRDAVIDKLNGLIDKLKTDNAKLTADVEVLSGITPVAPTDEWVDIDKNGNPITEASDALETKKKDVAELIEKLAKAVHGGSADQSF